jgi:5-methylthioadenosine/S-adenosylhomocysteine deaminase
MVSLLVERILIKNGIVVTMDDAGTIYDDGAVVLEQDKIVAVGKTGDIEKQFKGDVIIDARKKAVMPGLVDLHYHSSLGRGMYDNYPLFEFLDQFWYPKIRSMTPEDAYWGALCGYSEAIKSGTTTVNDQWRQMEMCADAARKIGIRAVLSNDVGDDEAKIDTIQDNEKLFEAKNGLADNRIRVFFGVEWVPIASEEIMLKTRECANKYKTGIHIHLNESQSEVEMSLKRHGKRPTVLAYDTGVLGADCVAAHCVWLSDEEIQLMAKTNTNISHNPSSNAKLGNGIARVPEYLKAGINVGLGHDSATCNNSLDIFETMKWAALIHRASRTDASLMPTDTVLRMATINAGKALHQNTGILRPGMKADIILINLSSQHFVPLITGKDSNLKAHLVYSAHGEDVHTTIIDGKIVMQNRMLTNVDEKEVIEKANHAFLNVLKKIRK